jgi:hypothetical protein
MKKTRILLTILIGISTGYGGDIWTDGGTIEASEVVTLRGEERTLLESKIITNNGELLLKPDASENGSKIILKEGAKITNNGTMSSEGSVIELLGDKANISNTNGATMKVNNSTVTLLGRGSSIFNSNEMTNNTIELSEESSCILVVSEITNNTITLSGRSSYIRGNDIKFKGNTNIMLKGDHSSIQENNITLEDDSTITILGKGARIIPFKTSSSSSIIFQGSGEAPCNAIIHNYGEIRGPDDTEQFIIKGPDAGTGTIINYGHDLRQDDEFIKYTDMPDKAYHTLKGGVIIGNYTIENPDNLEIREEIIDLLLNDKTASDIAVLVSKECSEDNKMMTLTNSTDDIVTIPCNIANNPNGTSMTSHHLRITGKFILEGNNRYFNAAGREVILEAKVEFSREDSLFQVPIKVTNNSEMTFPEGEFSVNKGIEVEKESKLIIEKEASVTMKAGSSLIL